MRVLREQKAKSPVERQKAKGKRQKAKIAGYLLYQLSVTLHSTVAPIFALQKAEPIVQTFVKQKRRTRLAGRRVAKAFVLFTFAFCLLPFAFDLTPFAFSQKYTLADHWPQFRGNLQNTAISLSPVPKELKLLWTYEDGESVESSAAIENGVVYIGTHKSELLALDLQSGAVRWKYATGDIETSSPCVSNGLVYIG